MPIFKIPNQIAASYYIIPMPSHDQARLEMSKNNKEIMIYYIVDEAMQALAQGKPIFLYLYHHILNEKVQKKDELFPPKPIEYTDVSEQIVSNSTKPIEYESVAEQIELITHKPIMYRNEQFVYQGNKFEDIAKLLRQIGFLSEKYLLKQHIIASFLNGHLAKDKIPMQWVVALKPNNIFAGSGFFAPAVSCENYLILMENFLKEDLDPYITRLNTSGCLSHKLSILEDHYSVCSAQAGATINYSYVDPDCYTSLLDAAIKNETASSSQVQKYTDSSSKNDTNASVYNCEFTATSKTVH
jgi:hypothetical protein